MKLRRQFRDQKGYWRTLVKITYGLPAHRIFTSIHNFNLASFLAWPRYTYTTLQSLFLSKPKSCSYSTTWTKEAFHHIVLWQAQCNLQFVEDLTEAATVKESLWLDSTLIKSTSQPQWTLKPMIRQRKRARFEYTWKISSKAANPMCLFVMYRNVTQRARPL